MIRSDRKLLEQLVKRYGKEQLLTEMNLSKKQLALIGGSALATASIFGLSHCANGSETTKEKTEIVDSVALAKQRDAKLFKQKVDALTALFDEYLGRQGMTINDVKLAPEEYVIASYKYGFDLTFMVAQAWIESWFGTTPRALKTNSVWSVGSYDDGRNKYYPSQKESIKDYINIINNDYLLNNKKTYNDLLKDGCFINYNNDRYAKKENYEKKLRNTMKSMNRKYPILSKPFETKPNMDTVRARNNTVEKFNKK